MNVQQSLILIISLSLLSGCSVFDFGRTVEPITVQTEAVERTPLNLPDPNPLNPPNVKWILITPENYESVFKKMKDSKTDLVLFGVTDEGFEELSITLLQLRSYILQQKGIIAQYREYYEPPTDTVK